MVGNKRFKDDSEWKILGLCGREYLGIICKRGYVR